MDTISSLHDDILCRILSFVTTKEAVATSVLSKCWTHLWLSVTNLHFTNINIDTIESNDSFNESVYSVLASRDAAGSNFVNSFCLHIQYSNLHIAYDLAFPHVVKWVNLFVQRKLKYLSLHLDVHEFPGTAKLPITIFTCKTLVSLDLYLFNFKLEGLSFSSNGFGLPSLKTLHLEVIHFSTFQDFMLLLAKCPNLEDLQADGMSFCCYEDSLSIHQKFKSISLPKLTRGNITRCFVFYDQANQPQHSYDAVHISHELTKLVLVNCWNISVMQALRLCSKLEHLELYKGLYMPMETDEGDQENWVEPEFVPQCLVSYLKTCTIRDSSTLQSELMLEKYILKNAKNLETMTIWSGREQSEIERKLSKYPKGSATCQLSVYVSSSFFIMLVVALASTMKFLDLVV